jgi:hypothetical protein
MIIYDSTLSQVMIYNGAWQAVVGGGTNWFNGTGAPATSLGSNGAYYLDTATGNVYLKSSGSWAIIYSPSTQLLSGNVFATTYNGTGSAPTITVQSHAGTGATADLSTDTNPTSAAFRVKLVMGTSSSAGALFTVAFPTAYSFKPKVVWSSNAGDFLGDLSVDNSSLGTSGFTFTSAASITSGTTFFMDFQIVG